MGVNGYKGHNYVLKGIVTYIKSGTGANQLHQIYIPSYHGEYNNSLVGEGLETSYPWAQCVSELDPDGTGAIVWVQFEGGDIRSPVITGSASNEAIEQSYVPGLTINLIRKNTYGTDGVTDATNVSASSLAALAAELVKSNESGGKYNTINANDNGALSIGLIQWHGNNARTLVNKIKTDHPNDFNQYGGKNLTLNLSASWERTILSKNDTNYNALKTLLDCPGGRAVQDAIMIEYMNDYMATARKLGLTDPAGLLYYCDCSTQSPAGARDVVKKAKSKDLKGLHEYVLTSGCWLARNSASRRKKSYDTIRGWESQGKLTEVISTGSGKLVWPVPWSGSRISSGFGNRQMAGHAPKFHDGIDISLGGLVGDNSKSVVATAAGTVVTAKSDCRHNYKKSSSCGCHGGAGNYITIKHPNNLVSHYLHLSSVTVKSGDTVAAGQVIGTVGCTGYSTGWHLHFQIQEGTNTSISHNGAVDPSKYVAK